MYFLILLGLGLLVGLSCRVYVLAAIVMMLAAVLLVALAMGSIGWLTLVGSIIAVQLGYAIGGLLRTSGLPLVNGRFRIHPTGR